MSCDLTSSGLDDTKPKRRMTTLNGEVCCALPEGRSRTGTGVLELMPGRGSPIRYELWAMLSSDEAFETKVNR